METKYNTSTYRDILVTLKEIEDEEDRFRKLRFWVCTFSILTSILCLIIYASIIGRIDVFFSGDAVKVFLIPLFSYLFMSFQEDLISERKSNLYESISNDFELPKEAEQFKKHTNGPMDEVKLKEAIQEIIKTKMQ